MTTTTTQQKQSPLTIWCNARLSPDALAQLQERLGAQGELRIGASLESAGAAARTDDPAGASLAEADVALGQPDPSQVVRHARVRWVHLTSATYARYDRDDVLKAMRSRGGVMTTSSSVFREPCAQHVLGMMLSIARRLPQAWQEQQASRGWPAQAERARCRILNGQTVMMFGYGGIAGRLSELLRPMRMNVIGVRRSRTRSGPGVRIVPTGEADALLGEADHVINLLPAGAASPRYFDEGRFDRMKAGAVFYNVGRGATVDHDALLSVLRSGRLAAAFLNVTDPEPPPRDHPLWSEPNCFITPHTAPGRSDESAALVEHFLNNLTRWRAGEELIDRVRVER